MRVILDIAAGWTECDACGNAQNRLYVTVNSEGYLYEHRSPCFGDTVKVRLTREQVLQEIENHKWLCHTQPAIRARRKAVRQIKSGMFEKLITEPPLAGI